MKLLRALVLAPFFAPACAGPTQITFVITTDEPCMAVKRTAIAVGPLDTLETKLITTESDLCDNGLLGKLVVIPSGATNAEVAVRVVTGLGKTPETCAMEGYKAGCIVARRALRFIPNQSITVPILMEASCVGIPCDPGYTCKQGQCVDAHLCGTAECPNTGKWKRMATSPLGKRTQVASVAVGRKVFMWGGYLDPGTARTYTNDGAVYDAATDTWKMMAATMLEVRGDAVAYDIGKGDILFWGGKGNGPALGDGAIYHSTNDTWTPILAAPMTPRIGHANVWTGSKLVVWGGADGTMFFADGAQFDVASNAWTPLPAASAPIGARKYPAAAFVAGKMIIYGGVDGNGGAVVDHASYDPMTGTWSPATQITQVEDRGYAFGGAVGNRALFWGGDSTGTPLGGGGEEDGFFLDTSDVLAKLPPATALVPPIRNAPRAVIGGTRMFVWGEISNTVLTNTGAIFDAASNGWTAMDASPLVARTTFVIAWTGTELVIWGGTNATMDMLDDGATYTP